MADNEELRKLERSLAYQGAATVIEEQLPNASDEDGDPNPEWFDLAGYEHGDDPGVDDSLRYLELRGLIERDTEHPTWIAIRNEEAETPTEAEIAVMLDQQVASGMMERVDGEDGQPGYRLTAEGRKYVEETLLPEALKGVD